MLPRKNFVRIAGPDFPAVFSLISRTASRKIRASPNIRATHVQPYQREARDQQKARDPQWRMGPIMSRLYFGPQTPSGKWGPSQRGAIIGTKKINPSSTGAYENLA